MTLTADRVTTALSDRYTIERELGAGGMATVYLAQDLKHDRQVAIKVLKPELAAVLGAERFVVEIKTTAALQHPHILPLFDSGSADGFLFYVMPYIQGETLRDKLSRETQLGIEDSVRTARDVADALDYAHRHGVVHRDIKPENILLHDGRPMVADFGIALALSAAAGGRMTETGMSLGTPHYMSPEQATADKEITGRSDIYSLGSVLFEMLTGNPPHTGSSAQQIIMKIIAEPVEPVTKYRKSVPPNVAAAVAKSLEKLPADRFESAKAFGEALGNPAFRIAETSSGAQRTRSSLVPRLSFLGVLGIAIIAAFWGWLKPGPPAVVSHQRIVLWENSQISPYQVGVGLAISPDGGTVVYVDSSAGGAQLFAKERDEVDATPLPGTKGALLATFSPDGAWIAFISDGKLMKIPRLGGSAITLADSANLTGLAWLDGGTILYGDPKLGVRAVSQDGNTPRQLLQGLNPADTASRIFVGLAALPGGQAALVTACTTNCTSSELRVLDLQSLTLTVLQDEALRGWALPGGDVAFVRRDGGVFAAPFSMGRLAFTKAPVPVMDGVHVQVFAVEMAVSANGTMIYLAASGSDATRYQPVWVTRTGAATPIDSAWTVPYHNEGCTCDGGLALSPDGRRLALTVPRDATNGDINIKQLDRAPFSLTPLTFAGNNAAPAWTADGQSVVYEPGSNAAGSPLVRKRSDGTGAVDTLIAAAALPRFTQLILEVVPTRDTMQFILRVSNGNIGGDLVLARRGDTTTSPLVTSELFSLINPALSPDGRWLAYASNETGSFEVYVRPFPDVSTGRVKVSQAGGTEPRWAHSGRELFFRNGAGALVAATVVPAATFTLGAQSTLFEGSRFFASALLITRSYDVAPGDQRFVFMRRVALTGAPAMYKLVQVTNWGAEVHAKLAGKVPK